MLYCALSKMTTPIKVQDPVRAELVDAAIRLLATDGAEALVLRRVASAAHVSTMCVYSRFGDKFGLINAVYVGGFELLAQTMSESAVSPVPRQRLIELGLAYRRFALANPALYSLMFERLVGFSPSPDLRSSALEATFSQIVDAMSRAMEQGALEAESPAAAAYTFWTTAHGSVSLELTHAAQSPLPDWFVDTPDSGEQVYMAVIETTLRGMAPVLPTVGHG